MKLLQNCWSELLILEFINRQIPQSDGDDLVLVSNLQLAHCQHTCYVFNGIY